MKTTEEVLNLAYSADTKNLELFIPLLIINEEEQDAIAAFFDSLVERLIKRRSINDARQIVITTEPHDEESWHIHAKYTPDKYKGHSILDRQCFNLGYYTAKYANHFKTAMMNKDVDYLSWHASVNDNTLCPYDYLTKRCCYMDGYRSYLSGTEKEEIHINESVFREDGVRYTDTFPNIQKPQDLPLET